MKIDQVTLYVIQIPFKQSFKHALATRKMAENVVVEIQSDSGVLGYGEAVPREYVTGESISSVLDSLQQYWIPTLWEQEWTDPSQVYPFLDSWKSLLKDKFNKDDSKMLASRCSIELSLLDLLGKSFYLNVGKLLNLSKKMDSVRYSGVVSGESIKKATKKAFLMRLYNFEQIKLKVGEQNDLEKIQQVRSVLGKKRDLRVDANGAWNAEEALKQIHAMAQYGVSAVEQPVPKGDLKGMQTVTEGSPIPIVADESFCSLEDAKLLFETKGCDILNIRLSKCGGLYYAQKIADWAKQVGFGLQLGCQVGETAILSSAGRIFAQSYPELKYLEGSYERFLLESDLTKKRVRFYYGGKAKSFTAPGLGFEVDLNRLDQFTTKRVVIKRSSL